MIQLEIYGDAHAHTEAARGSKIGGRGTGRVHAEYEKNTFRRVNGAVIHCVAGDGLGIMTAMVIARATGMTFWQEFWFEYAVGFSFGLFIFQLKSMKMMTDDTGEALWMAFRSEFFSMLTVMGGMGAVMCYVTPLAVTQQPKPLTFAFWGFGMLGLVVGYVATFPMNWMLVQVGWKHGMGPMKDAPEASSSSQRGLLFATMSMLGVAALIVPGWLAEARMPAAAFPATLAVPSGTSDLGLTDSALAKELKIASSALRGGQRKQATSAIDAARRAAEVGREVARRTSDSEDFSSIMTHIDDARRSLHNGDTSGAISALDTASDSLRQANPSDVPEQHPANLASYVGATVVDQQGREVGEILSASQDRLRVAAGVRDVFGVLDLTEGRTSDLNAGQYLLGPNRAIGGSLVMVVASNETNRTASAH